MLPLLLTAGLFVPAAEPAPETLAERLAPIVAAHKGKIAVAVKDLASGDGYWSNADEPMPTASLVKVAVMVEAYKQAEEGRLKLTDTVTLADDDKVPGAGILTPHFSAGATFSVRDAVRLMIVYSDNTATNLVLGKTGIKEVNARAAALGLKETRINAKVFRGSTTSVDPERTKKYGLGSTTANEMASLLEMIHAGKMGSPESTKAMLDHLKANDDKDSLVRDLPAGTVVAHKTGAVTAVRTDAGVVFVPDAADKKKTHPVVVCVLTDGNDDKRWAKDNAAQVTIGKIGRAVYDHFAAKGR